jgi:hypothetical protein
MLTASDRMRISTRVKMPRAAAALDSRRDGKSLTTKFMATLKAADPATLKRKRDKEVYKLAYLFILPV